MREGEREESEGTHVLLEPPVLVCVGDDEDGLRVSIRSEHGVSARENKNSEYEGE